MATRVVGVLQAMSLPPSSAPPATGWNDSCRAGFAPAEEWRLRTAHHKSVVHPFGRICLTDPIRSDTVPTVPVGVGI